MKNKRGFTLIEVLVAIGLVVMVAALMYTFVGQGLSLYTMETETAEEQTNLRQALSEITNRVRLADASEVAVTDGGLTVGSTAYAYSSAQKCILRDGDTFANNIAGFTATLNDSLLEISVTSTAGTVVSTSLFLS